MARADLALSSTTDSKETGIGATEERSHPSFCSIGSQNFPEQVNFRVAQSQKKKNKIINKEKSRSASIHR